MGRTMFLSKFEIYTIDVSNKDTVYETKKQANISIKQQTIQHVCFIYAPSSYKLVCCISGTGLEQDLWEVHR